MEDKKRYTKIDPKQYVQYTGPTRRYPRVNPFEKKIIAPGQIEDRNEAEKKADPEQENKDAAAAKD